MPDYKELLDNVGLRPFTDEELFTMRDKLVDQIQTGLNRTNESEWPADGGVQAIPTHVQPINYEQVAELPEGSVSIVAACGGTNWIFTVARKQADGRILLEEPVTVTIPEKNREHTFDSLMQLIADNVMAAVKKYCLEGYTKLPIAISFGFPQRNLVLENGDIDARILSGKLPKKWRIIDAFDELPEEDEKQTSLAGLLREKLLEGGMESVGRIVFSNDTVAVALDVQHAEESGVSLPAGFVFGTGCNAAMMGLPQQGIVNLEAGHARVPEEDAAFIRMVAKGYTQSTEPDIESLLGGGFIPYRIAAAMRCIAPDMPKAKQWAQFIVEHEDQTLISDLASGVLKCVPGEMCSNEDREFLQESANRALTQAGQMIAVQVAATVEVLRQNTGLQGEKYFAPFEGGVLKNAYGVSDTARGTLKQLVPDAEIELYTASGMVGIAKLAMI